MLNKTLRHRLLTGVAVTAALLIQIPMAGTSVAHGYSSNHHYNGYGQHHWGAGYGGHLHWKKRHHGDFVFERIATFPVFLNSDIDDETVAEIVAVSRDGRTLIYTDGASEKLGFVDITNPANPQPLGALDLAGEPTSVAVWKQFALAGVNTSDSFTDPSGQLDVVDIATQTIVHSLVLGGQPDSVAVSKDYRYAAVIIENERDEDLGDGEPPQAPAGFLSIIDTVDDVNNWTVRTVSLTGLADLFPDDPEPEYVSINDDNIAVVTMQENNYIVLVDLATGAIVDHFSAGTVDLDQIDTDDNDLIQLSDSLTDVPREPDGVTWMGRNRFVTADEGDLFGGSRGFTIFNKDGSVAFASGNALEHLTARIGHYPEGRSDNKGNEPENVAFAQYGYGQYLFVGSERANVIAVYEVNRRTGTPEFLQVLPAGGIGPEGLLAIPERGLFIAASEKDDRGDKFRSALTIFKMTRGTPAYPTVESANRPDGTPIPWGGLSALAIDPHNANIAYSVHDSVYDDSRIYRLDISAKPAVITHEIPLLDGGAVNLDPEGIAVRTEGGFRVVSEGTKKKENLLLKVADNGDILETILLPESVRDRRSKNGFEGVATVSETVNGAPREVVYIAFQREWDGDPDGLVRIGRYDTVSGDWGFAYYPIEAPTSPAGGWVGLSELTSLGDGKFAVIERDNQAGTDARIKLITQFDTAGVEFRDDSSAGAFDVLAKVITRDLVAKGDLTATGGPILEKLEGLAVKPNGTAIIINDNDGVDDATGETQLTYIHKLFPSKQHHHPRPKWGWGWSWHNAFNHHRR